MKWVFASLVIVTTTWNITEMMMEETNGTGCGETRYFSLKLIVLILGMHFVVELTQINHGYGTVKRFGE